MGGKELFGDRYHSFYHFGKTIGNYENKNTAFYPGDKLQLSYFQTNQIIKKERQRKKHALTNLDKSDIIIKKDV